jgi:DNA-directed RNA polymerase subunit F
VPFITISNNHLYNADTHELLGTVSETTRYQNDFDILAESFNGEYRETIQNIVDNNLTIYKIAPVSPQAVDLYYVMYQRDGSLLLVYGHYDENGQKNDYIRWIFALEYK